MKYFHTGLGQFSYHLGEELSAADIKGLSFTYLVPPGTALSFLKTADREEASFRRKFFPRLCRRYDLWHSTHQDSSYMPVAGRERLVLTIHDLNFLGEKDAKKSVRRLRRLQKKADRADALTVISDFTLGQVKEHLDVESKPIYRIYNGVPSQDLSSMRAPKRLILKERPFLLYLGVVRPKKNIHVLPALMHRLKDYDLVIAGGCDADYLTRILSEASRHGISERLHILGEVDAAEKAWLYSHCEAFLFPSLLEGFGIPVVEAMSLGKPVFISDRSSLPEVGGPDAFIWRDFDPGHMSDVFCRGMNTFASDAGMKERLQKQASRFSWKKAACEYVQVYRTVLGL